MTQRRVSARSATSARRKAGGPRTTVTKVNLVNGLSPRKGMKSYAVTTKKKK